MPYQFTLPLAVRDYECDYEGIVNNAVYLNYIEHTRHEFLKQKGIKVVELAQKGINLVVVRIEIDYLWPLRSGDDFYVGLTMERISRLRFAILEDIYRTADEKPILKAKVVATAIDKDGRPMRPPKELEPLLA
ncbi:MAG TPA: thioesterase family protein [Anaerolineales bacterium]|nr:thioesterase family protein [Anaerolineales bacterium]